MTNPHPTGSDASVTETCAEMQRALEEFATSKLVTDNWVAVRARQALEHGRRRPALTPTDPQWSGAATRKAAGQDAALSLPTPMGKHIEDVYPDEAVAADFDAWWSKDGQYLDPDTSDIPWFDKRRGLADYAFAAGTASRAWPDFMAPPQYVDPAPGWTDPALPDFRAIWSSARQVGYAVGLHGSMKRDCDLIAVPWIADPKSPEELIDAICDALKAREVGPREPKPDGRLAVNIQVDGWVKLIDLSIVLPASALSAARQQGVLEGLERGAQIAEAVAEDAEGITYRQQLSTQEERSIRVTGRRIAAAIRGAL